MYEGPTSQNKENMKFAPLYAPDKKYLIPLINTRKSIYLVSILYKMGEQEEEEKNKKNWI